MHYGIYTPNYGAEMSAQALAELAREAEEAGRAPPSGASHPPMRRSLRLYPNEILGASRWEGSSISKNSRFVKLNIPAMRLLGKDSIAVFRSRTFAL